MYMSFIDVMVFIKKQMQSYLNDEFKSLNLKSSEMILLQILYKEKSKSQIELSRIIECDKAHIHRIVFKLIDKNLIEYSKENELSKNLKLFLTDSGHDVASKIDKSLKLWYSKLLKGISKENLNITHNVINHMLHNAEQLKKGEIK